MLKAGALLYAVILSFIFVLISGSIILIHYNSSISQEQLAQEERLIINANSGINLLLAEWKNYEENTQNTVDLFEEGTDTVMLKTRQWGLFRVMSSTSKWRHSIYKKSCLAGYSADTSLTLYLAKTDNQLAVCGKTVLKGKCFLPSKDIKRAYIEGQTFQGDKLVDGAIEESIRALPTFAEDVISSNLNLLKGVYSNEDSLIVWESIQSGDISNSFASKTLIIESRGVIILDGIQLKGNIIVKSLDKIILTSNTKVEDIVLCAPSIEVEDNVEGSFHAIASSGLEVGEKCKINYPSSLAIFREQADEKETTHIQVGEGTIIKGAIVLYEQKTNFRHPTLVRLGIDSEIQGQVYTTGNLENRGKVLGNTVCNKFYLKTASSSYENHLLNAEFNVSGLSKYYKGIALGDDQPNYTVAKWSF